MGIYYDIRYPVSPVIKTLSIMTRMFFTAFACISFFCTSAQVTINFNNNQLFSNKHLELPARNSQCLLVAEKKQISFVQALPNIARAMCR